MSTESQEIEIPDLPLIGFDGIYGKKSLVDNLLQLIVDKRFRSLKQNGKRNALKYMLMREQMRVSKRKFLNSPNVFTDKENNKIYIFKEKNAVEVKNIDKIITEFVQRKSVELEPTITKLITFSYKIMEYKLNIESRNMSIRNSASALAKATEILADMPLKIIESQATPIDELNLYITEKSKGTLDIVKLMGKKAKKITEFLELANMNDSEIVTLQNDTTQAYEKYMTDMTSAISSTLDDLTRKRFEEENLSNQNAIVKSEREQTLAQIRMSRTQQQLEFNAFVAADIKMKEELALKQKIVDDLTALITKVTDEQTKSLEDSTENQRNVRKIDQKVLQTLEDEIKTEIITVDNSAFTSELEIKRLDEARTSMQLEIEKLTSEMETAKNQIQGCLTSITELENSNIEIREKIVNVEVDTVSITKRVKEIEEDITNIVGTISPPPPPGPSPAPPGPPPAPPGPFVQPTPPGQYLPRNSTHGGRTGVTQQHIINLKKYLYDNGCQLSCSCNCNNVTITNDVSPIIGSYRFVGIWQMNSTYEVLPYAICCTGIHYITLDQMLSCQQPKPNIQLIDNFLQDPGTPYEHKNALIRAYNVARNNDLFQNTTPGQPYYVDYKLNSRYKNGSYNTVTRTVHYGRWKP